MKQNIINHTEYYLSKAENHFQKTFHPVTIHFNLRGTAAGKAIFSNNQKPHQIIFNNALLEDNYESFLIETPAHEVAHIIAHEVFGNTIKPHGAEWQWIMMEIFSVTPETRHNFDTSRSSPRPFSYACACPERKHQFSKNRHTRSIKGSSYICRDCNSELMFTGQSSLQPKEAALA